MTVPPADSVVARKASVLVRDLRSARSAFWLAKTVSGCTVATQADFSRGFTPLAVYHFQGTSEITSFWPRSLACSTSASTLTVPQASRPSHADSFHSPRVTPLAAERQRGRLELGVILTKPSTPSLWCDGARTRQGFSDPFRGSLWSQAEDSPE